MYRYAQTKQCGKRGDSVGKQGECAGKHGDNNGKHGLSAWKNGDSAEKHSDSARKHGDNTLCQSSVFAIALHVSYFTFASKKGKLISFRRLLFCQSDHLGDFSSPMLAVEGRVDMSDVLYCLMTIPFVPGQHFSYQWREFWTCWHKSSFAKWRLTNAKRPH